MRIQSKNNHGYVNVSRLILGGNLIGGQAHSRDLIYVSNLIRNYFTDEKIRKDAIILKDILSQEINRQRPCRA
jgi:hypothetical protein